VVLGRQRNRDCLPSGLIEELLARGGRPLIIAGDDKPPGGVGTVVVGWKETPEAARAVTAAMPLLEAARRVVLLVIREAAGAGREPLEQLAQQLAWHGINAEIAICGDADGPAGEQLLRAATERQADLLVAGAFGHGALREQMFGGVTRTLLEHADLPVLLVR
jgi:nucleotide-binding universal stress UspA family protein